MAETKICAKCRDPKPVDDFYLRSPASGGRRSACKACMAAAKALRYAFDPGPELRSKEKHRVSKNEWYFDLKQGIKCPCGENDPRCLDFHHRDPSQKSFNVSNIGGRSKENILKEIAKCDVMCANCHRKKEFELNGFKNLD